MHLEHVNLTVNDLDRSIAFYCDLLGLHVRWKGTTGDGRPAAHVGTDDQYLALFQSFGDGPVDHDYTRPGINHFAFVVDDLDAAYEYVAAAGVKINGFNDIAPGRRLYFHDFDDHEVELVTYDT